MILGRGSYGEVTVRNNRAVKKFARLSHIIQEYSALRYLKDCKYIVKVKDVNFEELELEMELYDKSLKKWLQEKRDKGILNREELMLIIKDILLGLIELHDRQLAHGDLKPGNILIKENPLKTVLGDCGFVSIAKYSKAERTAELYRDPIVQKDLSHDMFSLGICLLEMLANIKINRQATYKELRKIVNDVDITHSRDKHIISLLLQEDRTKRPSARFVLNYLFKISPKQWIKPVYYVSEGSLSDNKNIIIENNILEQARSDHFKNILNKIDHHQKILSFMKHSVIEYNINRGKKGYYALICYLDKHNINPKLYKIHIYVVLMILSSIFGESKPGFREDDILQLYSDTNLKQIHSLLYNLLSDKLFINLLLFPSIT